VIVVTAEHQHVDGGIEGSDAPTDIDPVPIWHSHIENCHIGSQRRDPGCRIARSCRFPDDLNGPVVPEQGADSPAYDLVVIGQKDPGRVLVHTTTLTGDVIDNHRDKGRQRGRQGKYPAWVYEAVWVVSVTEKTYACRLVRLRSFAKGAVGRERPALRREEPLRPERDDMTTTA
jgi:hypothetical protein